jgi:hypothetical protein
MAVSAAIELFFAGENPCVEPKPPNYDVLIRCTVCGSVVVKNQEVYTAHLATVNHQRALARLNALTANGNFDSIHRDVPLLYPAADSNTN